MSGEECFVQGNEACVRGALYAGLKFFAGYPITPSTEMAELLSELLPRHGGHFVQMEDELASMCAVIGASVTGGKSMTATSGPGFSLMQEALGYAVMAEIPCVVASVQRGGPSTGLATRVAQGDVNQARWGTHGEHSIIALTASGIQDVFSITVEAFNMAETYRTPVILLFDEVVGHMRERLVLPAEGEIPVVNRLRTSVKQGVNYHPYLPREDGRLPMSDFGGVHRYNVTGLYHDIWGFPTEKPEEVEKLLYHLVEKIETRADEIAGILSGRREAGVHFLRQRGAQRAASGEHAAGQGHPGGPAGTADAVALSGESGAFAHGTGAACVRGGNEHGSGMRAGASGRAASG